MTLGARIWRRPARRGLLAVALLGALTAQALAQPRDAEFGTRTESDGRQSAGALPDAAREVRDRLAEDVAAARAEADRRIARQQEAAIAQLRTLADLYAATGRPADAAAVRREIERLSARAAAPDRVALPPATRSPTPAVNNFTAFRDRVGQAFPFLVTGTTEGAVWGTGAYTDDSSPGAAAVHAGLVKPGEQRAVLIRFLKGQEAYTPSSRNGIESAAYGHWDGTFTLEPLPAPKGGGGGDGPAPYIDTPNGLIYSLRGSVGAVILAQVTGASNGTIWGDGIYTDDSPLAVAAVHAGALREGEQGILRVAIRAACGSYTGATRYGVTSRPYGPFGGSYEILPPAGAAPLPAAPALERDAGVPGGTAPGSVDVGRLTPR